MLGQVLPILLKLVLLQNPREQPRVGTDVLTAFLKSIVEPRLLFSTDYFDPFTALSLDFPHRDTTSQLPYPIRLVLSSIV
jgi:hypothetical protein